MEWFESDWRYVSTLKMALYGLGPTWYKLNKYDVLRSKLTL
jgi:hypothetical protein